jgi:hypothetical protein
LSLNFFKVLFLLMEESLGVRETVNNFRVVLITIVFELVVKLGHLQVLFPLHLG